MKKATIPKHIIDKLADLETRRAERRSRAAHGSAALKDLALQLWMQDVTSLLCYQPEVPHAHKESLVKALDHYNKRCAECEQAKQQNAKGSATPEDAR